MTVTTPTTVVKIGTEFAVNTQAAGGQWYPTVTGLANGGFVVTWQDGLAGSAGSGSGTLGDSSFSSIKAQIYAADGTQVGTEFLINSQTTGSQAAPTITGLSSGGFVVTWQDQNSTSGDIKAQVYDANGTPSGAELLVNTVTSGNQNTPTITSLANGGFVVAWTNQTASSGGDIKAQVYDATGAKVGSEFLANSTSIYDQERASVATLNNGDFVVTWNDFRSGNWEVRGQVFHPTAAGASKVGAEFVVDTAFYNSRMTAAVTGLTNGNFVVSYEDTSGEIKSQVFSATGTKIGAAFVVNTNTSGNQGFPSITALTNGGFVMTWSDEGSPSDGSSSSIKAQVYDANGAKIGGEYLVNSQPGSNQYYPTTAALANGGFVITWQDFSHALGDTSAYGITAQIFNLSDAPNAPAIVSVTDDVGPVVGTVADGSSTNDTNLTVRIATGSNFAGDVVQLFDGATAIGSPVILTIANVANGYVDIQTGVLSNATHAITAKVTDATGAQSTAATAIHVTVDTVAPTVTISPVILYDLNNLQTVTVHGTAEAGQSVSVYDGAILVGTTTTGGDGSWSLAGVTLLEGANNLSAKATDAAGNVGTSTTFAAPTVVSTGTTSVDAAATTAMGYIVLGSGTLDIVAGGNVDGFIQIGNGGVVDIGTGATAQHTVILNGGSQYDYGNADDTYVRSGGAQHVYHGGSATGTTVAAGGYQDVWNGTVTDTSLSGAQQVHTGGTSVHTVIENGGSQYVGANGTADSTVINAGGFQYVDADATATDTVITGGSQYVVGTATGTTGGGNSTVGGGESIGAIVENGGAQHVYYGGSATGTTVAAGGFQDVYNSTVTDTNLSGEQQVLAGGMAIHTVIAGGARSFVGSGGATEGTVINAGGLQYLDAGSTSTNTIVDGGYEYVGGTANATTVTGGGQQYVGSGGIANGTHLASGTEHVQAGGTAQGVDFAGSSGTLLLDDASSLTGTISNFELGDTIDLLNTSVISFEFDGSTLTLATASGNVSYQFADVEAGTEFNVASDGQGGTAISLSLLTQFSASLVPEPGAESNLVAQDTTPIENPLTNVQA